MMREKIDREYLKTDLIYNVTEDILLAMENADIQLFDIARKVGKTQSNLKKMLQGDKNISLGLLSDICYVLDLKLEINIGRR